VKTIVRRKLAREKRRIERRLESAVRVNAGAPLLSGANIEYEVADRTRAIAHGGIGVIQRVVKKSGLARKIDAKLDLLRIHKPYHESDHVLNIAYNALFGGQRLEDIELRRNDRVLLDALGTASLPDPTTAGDFCRRFGEESLDALMEAINEARLEVWRTQPGEFFSATARIDADASIVPTTGDCKQGMEISYNGIWGYSALMVSLANTGEVLYLVNHGANRPSHEGVIPRLNQSIELCRRAGFTDILLRGDTDFSITTEFDRWNEEGVRFVFGYDARANMVERAESTPDGLYHELVRRAERVIRTQARTKPEVVKDRIVRERKFRTIRGKSEEVCEFEYRPGKCRSSFRVVALRKNLSIEKGDEVLFDEIRYFFFVTNDRTMTADEVVHEGRGRCNQENVISQLKSGVRALHAPVNTLHANWAYMVMTSLAWNLKAWTALLLPIHPRWADAHQAQQRRLLTMEFRTFVAALIHIPAQIVRTARKIRYRVLAWNAWQSALFRLASAL
jgi:hypothetical protein